MSNKNMIKELAVPLIRAALFVGAIGDAIVLFVFDNRLTIRAIKHYKYPFTVPFETHGGTVYITEVENWINISCYLLVAIMLGAQFLVDRMKVRINHKL